MFFDEEPSETVTSNIGYFRDRQPPEYLELLRRSIRLLDTCVAAARGHRPKGPDSAEAASLDLLVGFGMLAMSESRALLLLASLGLEQSAHIHLRSLYEYTFRATLVQKPETAAAFKAAAAAEVLYFFEQLDRKPDENAEAFIAQYTRGLGPDEKPVREKKALGGTMRALMEREYTDSKSAYATNFSFPSLFSHGSILSLGQVSRQVAGRGKDFPEAIFRNGQGHRLLTLAAGQVLQLVCLFLKAFGVRVEAEWHELTAWNEKLARADAPPNAGA